MDETEKPAEESGKMDRAARGVLLDLLAKLYPFMVAAGVSALSAYVVSREERLEAKHERQHAFEMATKNQQDISALRNALSNFSLLESSGFHDVSLREGVRLILEPKLKELDTARDRRVVRFLSDLKQLNPELKVPAWD